MANRIAGIAELSVEQLTTIEAEDVELKQVPEKAFDQLSDDKAPRFRISCPQCEHGKDVPYAFLGQRVRCPKCEADFEAAWGSLTADDQSTRSGVIDT